MKNIQQNKIYLWLYCLILISFAGCTGEQARERNVLRQINKVVKWELNKDKTLQKDKVLVALYLDTEEIEDSTKTAEYRCYSLSYGGRGGYSGIKTISFGVPWSTWEQIRTNSLKKEIVIDPGPPYETYTKVVNLIPGKVTNLGRIVLEKVEAEGSVSISGTIKNEHGEPLEGVEVSSPKGSAVTDSQGHYRIDGFGLDVYDLTAVRNGYISAGIKVSIRDTDNSVIEKDFVLSSPRKIRLRYVISPKEINDFSAPGATAGTVVFSVDKTFQVFPIEQIESSDFRQFINRVRMDVRLVNGRLTLSNSYAPIFYERLRSLYVDFEIIRGVDNLDYGSQHCPPIEQGDIILIDGGKISSYAVKILFEEIQPVRFLAGGSTKAVPCEPLTQSQVDKFVAAVWKEAPRKIDITIYKDIMKPPMPEDEIREMFEDTFTKTYGPKEHLTGQELEQFNTAVQMNVERTIKEQQAGRKVKQRIRIDGNRQRIDQVFARPATVLPEGASSQNRTSEVSLGPNTPWEMTIISQNDKEQAGNTNFTYYHRMKTAQKNSNIKGQKWSKSDAIDLANFPVRNLQEFLGSKNDTPTGPAFVPDESKIAEFSNTGQIGAMTICINPNSNMSVRNDRVEIKGLSGQGETILLCDKNDYSRVYYTEIRILQKPLYIKECNDFDSWGFPHKVSVTEYDLDGGLKKKEIYEVVDVNLNPSIPDEVFAFNPPDEYEILEVDPNGIKKVIREKGGIDGAMRTLLKAQKEKDVETLKGLLVNEIWQIRLRSLQVLEPLLVNDNNELKDYATVLLENDENQEVRGQAEKILHRIEAMGSRPSSDKQ